MARWSAALRIGRRQATRGKGRTAIAVALIALPVAAVTFLSGTIASTTPTDATRLERSLGETAQARIWAPSARTSGELRQNAVGTEMSYGDDTSGEEVSLEAVEALDLGAMVPAQRMTLSVRSDSALVPRVAFHEVDGAQVPGLLGAIEGDHAPSAGQVVLQRQLAARLGVGLGDTVELLAQAKTLEVEVVGTGRSSSNFLGILGPGTLTTAGIAEPQIGALQPGGPEAAVFIVGDSPVLWPDIVTLNAAGFAVESRAMMLDPPPPESIYGGAFGTPGADSATVGFAIAVLAIGALEVLLLVGPAFAVGAKRNARTLALVAAAGGRPGDLRRIVLATGVVTGAVAGAAGIALGLAAHLGWYGWSLRAIYPPANFAVPWMWPLVAGAFAVVLGAVAAWIPARRAGKTDVVSVLTGRREEARMRRSVPWVGAAITVAGVATSLIAAVLSSPLALAAGGVAVLVGIVVSSGVLVDLAGRFATHFSFATKYALRDAARHRSRTAPAVAAILAAVAVATGGLIFTATEDHHQTSTFAPLAADGTGLLFPSGRGDFTEIVDDATRIVHAASEQAGVTEVNKLMSVSRESTRFLEAIEAPAAECTEETLPADHPQCAAANSGQWGLAWQSGLGTLVDDGTMVTRSGLPGAEDAAAALADGKALVSSADLVWPDGELRIAVADDAGERVEELALPAHVIEWGNPEYDLVLPLSAAQEIATEIVDGGGEPYFEVQAAGALITGVTIDQSLEDEMNRRLYDLDPNLTVMVEGRLPGMESGQNVAALIVPVTIVIALLATILSIALAMAESRPDLATLAALGAAPRGRRRIVSAQAGTIAVLGTVCGTAGGALLGYILVNWQASTSQEAWQVVVPWLAVAALLVGIPILALTGGWLLAPSRLPMRSRVAQ